MRCLFYIAYFALYFNTLNLYCQIKQTQDEEKKQLTALRDLIKSSLQLDQKEVGTSPEDISSAFNPKWFDENFLSLIYWSQRVIYLNCANSFHKCHVDLSLYAKILKIWVRMWICFSCPVCHDICRLCETCEVGFQCFCASVHVHSHEREETWTWGSGSDNTSSFVESSVWSFMCFVWSWCPFEPDVSGLNWITMFYVVLSSNVAVNIV